VALAPAITAALMGGGGLGIGGLIAAGPVGWGILAGGALLGGAVGGMFGPHLNAQNAPDLYMTSQYGQAMANMGNAGMNGNSAYTANGQQFNEDSSLATQLGGKGEISYIADYIKKNPTEAAKLLTPQQLQEFTGANTMLYKANGMVDTGNGQLTHWDTLSNNANDATQAILKQIAANTGKTASNTAPIFEIDRLAPDFNTARVSSWNKSDVIGDLSGAVGSYASKNGVAGSATRGTGGGTVVHINNPVLLDSASMDALASKIQQINARNTAHNFGNLNYEF
jgi:hypothetical protein